MGVQGANHLLETAFAGIVIGALAATPAHLVLAVGNLPWTWALAPTASPASAPSTAGAARHSGSSGQRSTSTMPSFACASSAPEPATGARIETPAAVRDVVMMDEIAPRPPQSEDGLALTRPQDPVFATGRRTSLSQRNATRAFAKSVERAELADVSFHTLRHTFASLLIAHGRDPLFVADQLGHASAKTMLDVYSHLFRAAREAREARSQLDAEYGRCCGREQTERKQQRQKMAGNPSLGNARPALQPNGSNGPC